MHLTLIKQARNISKTLDLQDLNETEQFDLLFNALQAIAADYPKLTNFKREAQIAAARIVGEYSRHKTPGRFILSECSTYTLFFTDDQGTLKALSINSLLSALNQLEHQDDGLPEAVQVDPE